MATTILQTNLPEIMAQVESQLLSFVPALTSEPVAGDITNIYQIFRGESPKPGQTGQRDILLIERADEFYNVSGEGRFAMIYSAIDISLRASNASDRRGTDKQWLVRHQELFDALMDAMAGFFPVDSSGNAYTIEGFVLDTNSEPLKDRDTVTWGQKVGTYRFHYRPKINTTLLTV